MADCTNMIREARQVYTQLEIAEVLGVSSRTVRRWEKGETVPPDYLAEALEHRLNIMMTGTQPASKSSFKFIDLFAGIGGTRLGFERHGGKCVFTSEWDDFSRKTYLANFPQSPGHIFAGDITKVVAADIPDHDILLAGFPCQPFSIAGVSKKNSLGIPHGFENKTQGTLFFDVARILKEKKPKAFMLENVKNLISHDRGKTFRIITETLADELKYDVHFKVIDGNHFVPQHRERIYIVGFRNKTSFSWSEMALPDSKAQKLASVLHPENHCEIPEPPYTGDGGIVNEKYVLSENLWAYLQAYAKKHKLAGNGFGFGLTNGNGIARTLSARYYKDGSEILIERGDGLRPRRLTPRECSRLMGFPSHFKIPVSDTQAYKQFGNSVIVPVVESIAKVVVSHLHEVS